MFKKRTKKQGSVSKETRSRDGSSKNPFRMGSSRRSPTTETKQKRRSKSVRKRSASRASKRSSSTASTDDSTVALTVESSHASRRAEIPGLSNSGSDVTTGPMDDLLFALGDAIAKGANEVEDFVEVKMEEGFESLKNNWDRFTVGLTLMYGDNSTISSDFSDEKDVELVMDKRYRGSMGIRKDKSQSSAKGSVDKIKDQISDQVNGLIDSFFLVEV